MERYRTTLIMLAALVALLLVWLLVKGNAPAATTTNATLTPTVAPSQYVWQETGTPNSIDVMSGTTTVSLRQDLSTTVWSLVAPIQATADSFTVGPAADSLKNVAAIAILTNTTDLAQYGLDKPILKVDTKFGGAKSAEHVMQIGNATIDGSGYYVKADSKPDVYVVSNATIEPLKSWLTTPPKAQPTATPQPPTPAGTLSPSGTITATGTLTLSVPIGTSTVVTGSTTVTNTLPGAANPTTPAPSATP